MTARPRDRSGTAPPSRGRVRAARALHGAASLAGLLLLEVLLFGGVRFRLAGVLVSATTWTGPAAAFLGLTAAGLLAAPRLPARSIPLVRGARWLFGVRRLPNAAVASVLIVAVGVQAWLKIRQDRLAREAKRLMAYGRNAAAAAKFLEAALPLDPRRVRWVGRSADCEFRAGRFQRAVEMMEGYYRRGAWMERRGYRALWRSYAMLGRTAEAARVVRVAMASHRPALDREGRAVLLELNRILEPGSRAARPHDLVYRASAPVAGPLFVTGNWENGRQTHGDGWQPVEMSSDDGGVTWHARLDLAPADLFPYVALVVGRRGGLAEPARALAQFWVRPSTSPRPVEVELRPLPPIHSVPAAQRRRAADGHPRVVVLWPDGGSWQFVHPLVRRGLMPNLARMMRRGGWAELTSTNPAYTSTAYRAMTHLDPTGWYATGTKGTTVYDVLRRHGKLSAVLVFEDQFLGTPDDRTLSDGTRLPVEYSPPPEVGDPLDEDEARRIVRDTLGVDAAAEPGRAARLLEKKYLLLGVRSTREKADLGLRVWRERRPDLLLLRFPGIDNVSHKYFQTVSEDPVDNALVELYRHLDRVIGRFTREIDEDDTLVLVSDHGVRATFPHHRACVLVVSPPGGGRGARGFRGIRPIASFPDTLLGVFGLRPD